MSHKSRISLTAFVLILATLACNLPFEQIPPPNDVQTAAALTLQAIVTASFTSTTSPSQTAETPLPSPTGSPAGTTTVTPTYSVPMLTVQESTNCRKGPGEEYEVVVTYLAGKKLEIVGRYEPGNFWLVKSTEILGETCWLWGQYVEVTGSYWVVSSVTPPPTATNPPPQVPVIERYEFLCSRGKMEVTIIWADRADNETGYRIIRNGELAANLPADSTTFTDTVDLTAGQSVAYRIEVFNSSGSQSSSTINITC